MADSIVGSRKTKPAPSSTAGTTRADAEHLAGELAEHGLQRERGRRQDRRPAEDLAHDVGDLGVRHRVRAGEVDRAREVGLLEQEPQGAHLVAQRDQRPVLAARAELAADAELEQREHAGPGPARFATTSPVRGCTTRMPALAAGAGGGLPGPHDVGEEAAAGGGGLVDGGRRCRRSSRSRTRTPARGASGRGRASRWRWCGCRRRGCRGSRACSRRSSGGRRRRRRRGGRRRRRPARASRSTVPALGSQVTSSGAAAGRRTRRTTSWPSERRWGTRAVPMSPDAPVTATLMALSSRERPKCAHSAAPRAVGPWIGRSAQSAVRAQLAAGGCGG